MPPLPRPARTFTRSGVGWAIAFALASIGPGSRAAADSTAHASPPQPPSTFARDVLPILQAHCQDCHRPNQIAPISFLNYEQVRPWAKAIRQSVIDRSMPPFNVTAPLGHFQDDSRLTDEKIAVLVDWVDGGAREGNPADAPPPIVWDAEGWALGTPDLVLDFPAYTSKPNNTDEHLLLFGDYVFPRNTWIQAIELRSSDYRLLHHAGVFTANDSLYMPEDRIVDSTDEHLDKFGATPNDGFQLLIVQQPHLYTWLPGQRVERRPEGEGFRVARGERVLIQAHVAPTTEAVPLKVSLGIKLVNGELRAHSKEITSWMTELRIPPGVSSHVERQWHDVIKEITVTGFYMHMHLRGKSAQIFFHYPDGRSEAALDVPQYNFNWQREYVLAKPVTVPAGTRIEFVGEWDNSSGNPHNPDPAKEVVWGGKTTDEMYSANVYYREARLHPLRIERGLVVGPAPQE